MGSHFADEEKRMGSYEKLNGLVVFSIKKAMVRKINYASAIKNFATKNARNIIYIRR